MVNDAKDAAKPLILVVDNDPLIRLGTVFMLREMGFTAHSADGADRAIAMMTDDIVPDLLITDYAMPGGDGITLAHDACALHHHLKILIVTGHAALHDQIAPNWGILGKPFTAGELHDSIGITMGLVS